MPQVEVCFTPQAFPLFANENAYVVVIDVLRATSAICTAFHHGISKIIPVASIDEAKEYQSKGYLAAAERNGEVVEGFEFGNSPFSYMGENIKGKTLALTTTNGTQAINAARNARKIFIGSFLNANALSKHLIEKQKDVIFLCAGWKNKFNMEDTLLAGLLAKNLHDSGKFETSCDSALAAKVLYQSASNNIHEFLGNSSHRNRLARLNLDEDIRFCLQLGDYSEIPVLEGKYLVVQH